MSKIYIPMPSKEKLSLYLEQDFDGFFIGIKDFSSNFNNYVDINELEELVNSIKEYKKDLYVCFNRLIYNDEIDSLKEVINRIIKLDNIGIAYTDVGVLNILKEANFKGNILWYSNHLGTNSKTINFLGKRDVNNVLVSTEISVDEIISIKKNSNINIGATLYGFLNMATSSRKLLTNYFLYIDKNKKKDNYVMKNKDKEYIVVEDFNTNFFTGAVLNGIKFFPKLIDNNIDFIFLDDYMLSKNNFYNVIEAFSSLRRAHTDKDFVSKLEEVVDVNTFCDTFYGFLDKETVYKVEDYE